MVSKRALAGSSSATLWQSHLAKSPPRTCGAPSQCELSPAQPIHEALLLSPQHHFASGRGCQVGGESRHRGSHGGELHHAASLLGHLSLAYPTQHLACLRPPPMGRCQGPNSEGCNSPPYQGGERGTGRARDLPQDVWLREWN